MRLYYVRHGLTDWNVAGRLQGHRDVPLNDVGRAQALQCAGRLGDLFARDGRTAASFDYVSSPLVRARETMEIMRMSLGLEAAAYVTDERLIEIGFGEWEGLTYEEVMRRDPNLVEQREANKWLFRPPGGENYQQVALRVAAWHAALAQDTVVCAHGGTGRALIAVLEVVPTDQAVHHSVDQGVVYVFEGNHLARYA